MPKKKIWKEVDSLEELSPGSVVRHMDYKRAYIVTTNFGERVTAVDSVDITNPGEWEVLLDK